MEYRATGRAVIRERFDGRTGNGMRDDPLLVENGSMWEGVTLTPLPSTRRCEDCGKPVKENA